LANLPARPRVLPACSALGFTAREFTAGPHYGYHAPVRAGENRTSPAAAAVILASGAGVRVGGERNKVYLPLGGRSVLAWSVRTFAATPGIAALLVVIRPQDRPLADTALSDSVLADTALADTVLADTVLADTVLADTVLADTVLADTVLADTVLAAGRPDGALPAAPGRPAGPAVEIIHGGVQRQDSELMALRHLSPRITAGEIDVVLMHDAARPLVSGELVSAVLTAAAGPGGAVPGVPRHGLVLASEDGAVAEADLGTMMAMQTPQGFPAGPLLEAYERAAADGFYGTDTAACMTRHTGLPARCVPGDEHNIKITYPHDLVIAEKFLASTGRTPCAR
jgi:2-C-methyl-D-erythritol 4-phosphate cytidylyltransferase